MSKKIGSMTVSKLQSNIKIKLIKTTNSLIGVRQIVTAVINVESIAVVVHLLLVQLHLSQLHLSLLSHQLLLSHSLRVVHDFISLILVVGVASTLVDNLLLLLRKWFKLHHSYFRLVVILVSMIRSRLLVESLVGVLQSKLLEHGIDAVVVILSTESLRILWFGICVLLQIFIYIRIKTMMCTYILWVSFCFLVHDGHLQLMHRYNLG